MQRSFIGIDFGTTNTSVSQILFDDLGGTKLINYGEDKNLYPFASMLAIHKQTGEMRFGRDVKRRRMELEAEYFIISSFKSLLGTGKEFFIADKKYSGADIVARYLLLIKRYINDNYDLEITEATFALPIGFSAKARAELKFAVKSLSFPVKTTQSVIFTEDFRYIWLMMIFTINAQLLF